MRQQTTTIDVDGARLIGIEVEVTPPGIFILAGEKGFVGCGYFAADVANRAGHAVATVPGVSCWDDLLAKKVTEVSDAAAALGIAVGMSGREAAKRLA